MSAVAPLQDSSPKKKINDYLLNLMSFQTCIFKVYFFSMHYTGLKQSSRQRGQTFPLYSIL